MLKSLASHEPVGKASHSHVSTCVRVSTFFACVCLCVCVFVALGVFGHQDEKSGLQPGGGEQMEREGKGQLYVVHVGVQASQAPPKKLPTPSVKGTSHRLRHIPLKRISTNNLQ